MTNTRGEVASRAGVEPAFVDRLCELGILRAEGDDFTEGDVRRTRILHGLVDAGIPIDAIGKGIEMGVINLGFVDDPAYALFTGLTAETFADVSARTGIPFEVLSAMREAAGAPSPSREDRLRELEADAIPAIQLQIEYGFQPESLERALRAWGDSLRRMADVESALWASEVMGPLFATGRGLADIGQRTAEFSNALQPLTAREIIALYHGQQSHG